MKKFFLKILELLLLLGISLWAYGAFVFLPDMPAALRTVGPIILLVDVVLTMFRKTRRVGYAGVAIVLAFSLYSFFSVRPSNDRDWEGAVAKLPSADINGNLVTIHNIRNFQYKTETDFTPSYYDKTFNVDEISSVDFLVVYWAGKPIAHLMVSFGFADKDFITFSIETRKERTESYSTLAGFYRNYELTYIAADERDVIGLRTKIRDPHERVYLFRARTSLNNSKKFFLDYVDTINRLKDHPEFYNTLMTNCTTRVLNHAQSYAKQLSYNWKILLSGYIPDFLYESGALDKSHPFDELFTMSQVNERANQDLVSDGFSERIRAGIPRPPRRTKDTFDE